MAEKYSIETCRNLESMFHAADLHRPMRVERHEPGSELVYDVTGVADAGNGKIRVNVEKFIGGGFAGQVYRVRVLEVTSDDKPIAGIEAGNIYAMKILVPPSGFSRFFRNSLYWAGFQGPFQLQVNPDAARAGALWQKFIRRGAKVRFGDEKSVADILAIFVDPALGSCGELSEWIDGRTWRLEVDDHLDLLKKWRRGKKVDESLLGSPEYRAKYEFMQDLVRLLHDMGAHEFARQYEWATCKSQPNCLKRKDTENNPSGGLVAVDFRAGLALLPFLPMSPGDFKLIIKGLLRGSLVQFDRGSISRLERFISTHSIDFEDMRGMLEDLKRCERIYRDSVPDITHNHFRLLFSRQLWSTILDSAVAGWRVRNLIDDKREKKLAGSRTLTILFFLIGLIPFFGRPVRKTMGHAGWRKHYAGILTSLSYFKRAFKGKAAEKVIAWHRTGRINDAYALKVAGSGWRFFCHFLLSLIPLAVLHRLFTDWKYAKERIANLLVRPVRLYFNADLRKKWLRDMVAEGQKKQIISNEDAGTILSQIDEPFIQKYLKSLAVHVCTLPVTQVVSLLVVAAYIIMRPELSLEEAGFHAGGILIAFQVTPISPGSIVRGLYVLFLVVRERNFKDYNIAVFLGFFKYIGYLAFPIQMTYRYPVLARFMAANWANKTVHIVPVFGESGALLEHWVYGLFYNSPLTTRRRINKRIEKRASMDVRYWHIVFYAIAAAGVFGFADYVFLGKSGTFPGLKDIWWLSMLMPIICGSLVTLGCGGAALPKRFVGAAAGGILAGLFYTAVTAFISQAYDISVSGLAAGCVWRMFVFAIFSTTGAIIAELNMDE